MTNFSNLINLTILVKNFQHLITFLTQRESGMFKVFHPIFNTPFR